MSAYTHAENGDIVPFTSALEVWFWFIDAQEARSSGAYLVAGVGLYPRPCEPVDILGILDRLYRSRRLLMDHFLVLRHYGQRKLPPDPYRIKEQRAYTLWNEAMNILEEIFIGKGIVKIPQSNEKDESPSREWHKHALVWENKFPTQCVSRSAHPVEEGANA